MSLEACLPPELRGPGTVISTIAAGLSGASVHRVESRGRAFVLKVAGESEGDAEWRAATAIQRTAADAGLSPRVVHVDEAHRAVLTDFVADRSFTGWYRDPRTHGAAVDLLGRTVRRVHALPIPAEARRRDPREFLAQVWGGLLADLPLPDLVGAAVRRALAEAGAPPEREVLGHNDLNPSNLIFDGEAIVLLDWAAAAPADPLYDLATLAVFLRMDDDDSLRLLAAYEGRRGDAIPDRFRATCRLVAALAGAMQLYVARRLQHPGATEAEALPLAEFYQQLRAGKLALGTPAGQWAFGLALLADSLAR
ncbi:MAG: hypothetical protein JWM10_5016 [Myxococcaceae bacterium]|nr:hypothetical protein [Myxococcaceae bacterium]